MLAGLVIAFLVAMLAQPASANPRGPAASIGAPADSPYLNGVEPVVSSAGFVHPGIYNDLPSLEYVRRQIAIGAEPWASVFDNAKENNAVTVQMNWDVFSRANNHSKECDPTDPDGCVLDCSARGLERSACTRRLSFTVNSAYLNALLWYYTGEEKYAQNSVRMLNGYARIFRGFPLPSADGSQSGVLAAAWMAQTLLRGAEIIRYTYSPSAGKPDFDTRRFSKMVRESLVPRFRIGVLNNQGFSMPTSNWRSSAIEALMNAGIYLDDRALYNEALAMWREFTPSYIYLESDGPRPNPFPADNPRSATGQACYWIHWNSDECLSRPMRAPDPPPVYQNGQSVEVCRDMWHAGAGVGGLINAAETAGIQGDDLYGEQRQRLKAGVSYLVQIQLGFPRYGYPDGFCAGAASFEKPGLNGELFPEQPEAIPSLSLVVAYNHFVTEEGGAFPMLKIPGYGQTTGRDPVADFIEAQRLGPQDGNGLITSWTTLTHYGVGEGVPPTAAPMRSTPTPTPTPSTAPTSPPTMMDGESPWTTLVVGVVGGATILLVLCGFALVSRPRRPGRRQRRPRGGER